MLGVLGALGQQALTWLLSSSAVRNGTVWVHGHCCSDLWVLQWRKVEMEDPVLQTLHRLSKSKYLRFWILVLLTLSQPVLIQVPLDLVPLLSRLNKSGK